MPRQIIAALLGLLAMAGCSSPPEAEVGADGFRSLFERMGPARQGDWLDVHPEREQTYGEYLASSPNRPTASRRLIHITPMGQIGSSEPGLLPAAAEFLHAFFCMDAVVAEQVGVPDGALDARRKQHDASAILDALAARLPLDAAASIGVLEYDLFAPDLNFVFGLGSFENRASVFSIARYRFEYMNQPKDATLLKRTCKVAAHEIGHIFGLRHCTLWRCVMNGSNSIVEADGRPMFLCPGCLDKLRWNLGFDPAARYAKLAAFYERHEEFHADAKRALELKAAWERE